MLAEGTDTGYQRRTLFFPPLRGGLYVDDHSVVAQLRQVLGHKGL